MKKRLVLKTFGEVQGINFRSMVKMKCIDLGLNGVVKNYSDGSVYIEAEGEQEKLENLVVWVNSSPSFSKVTGVEDFWSECQDKFEDFRIEY
ncbi:MAG: acylphosphatase [Patescibacteria group bacterium]